ncbi:ROK family transcriptional regulator [Rhizobium sp. NFR07]|uniref:ROK family transcriptional regulator n=1 Tax=Rhizobium sp. NFR07 TaxID=1566262 RepID=UPI001FCD9408|nr:ROK family transcriptional regulator [Rhizobium sp. NFR07]
MIVGNAVGGQAGKASTELVRQANSSLVLSQLRKLGRLAHTEISAATGLSSATVSAITADLEAHGVIERVEQQAAGGRGRPRVLFGQRRGCGHVIAVIISSDVIEYSLVDYGGTLIDRFSEPRGRADPAPFVAELKAALDRLIRRSSIARDGVLCISISSKGLVDAMRPILVWSPILGSQPIDFAEALGDWEGTRVLLSNETLLVAGALCELEDRKDDDGRTSLAALSLGHSVGLGVAQRSDGGRWAISAPNFGHMLHVPNGALCRCGALGCVEAYAGFYAILRNAFDVPLNTIPAKFVPFGEIEKIAGQARQGGHRAQHAFRQAGIAIGNGLSRLLSLHGHMPMVLTGPGAQHFDLLRAGVEEGLRQSQVIRLLGMPDISVMPDERSLVFTGHLSLAFSVADRDIIQSRPAIQAAGE